MSVNLNYYLDLEAYNCWANEKLLALTDDLSAEQLLCPRNMGMGSLLATIQHIASAEQVWLDRWQGKPTQGLPPMPDRLADLKIRFGTLAQQRRDWFQADPQVLDSLIEYRDLRGNAHRHRLGDLVAHVMNHGVHHRSQWVHYLKHCGKTLPGGLDYIFYRIAAPTIALREDVAQGARSWGLEVGTQPSQYLAPNHQALVDASEYTRWATKIVLDQVADWDDAALDKDWSIGMGSIRATLLHLLNAEQFWENNFRGQTGSFPRSPADTPVTSIAQQWDAACDCKLDRLQATDSVDLGRSIVADFGSGPFEFRYSEAIIQLTVHGTLHRAQLCNMIRSSGRTPEQIDYIVWVRQRT